MHGNGGKLSIVLFAAESNGGRTNELSNDFGTIYCADADA